MTDNKVRITVTITVRRGDEKYRAMTRLTEEPPTKDTLDFLPLQEYADHIADDIAEMVWEGPNPGWTQESDSDGNGPVGGPK